MRWDIKYFKLKLMSQWDMHNVNVKDENENIPASQMLSSSCHPLLLLRACAAPQSEVRLVVVL